MPHPRLIGLLACACWAFACGSVAQAQPAGEIQERRSDLADLKKRIDTLQQELARTEANRSEAVKGLRASERAVSRAARELARLEGERKDAEKSLDVLEAEQRATAGRIDARRGELGDWLRRHYMHGAADGVAPLLAARDPNQLARDMHYLEHLGRARLALIEGLRADLLETQRRADEIAQRRDRLAALADEQRARRQTLEREQAQRKKVLAQVSSELQKQKKAVGELRADEKSLGRVIDTLVRRAREQAEREAARLLAEKREAERRAAAQRAAEQRAAAMPGAERERPSRRAEPVVGEVRATARPTPTGVAFGDLRGRLRFPVRGELLGRFGAPRAEGGTTWKGVFIRAGSGAEVRAIAGGEVVFSDWLRGYGNLIIIDHGGDYLTVYGNNDMLLKDVGDRVGGGDSIARVGAGGVGNESGLYFEIRRGGQPLDPMQWVRLD